MKRLLLATAAVIALAVAAPMAAAQYTTPPPATAPYTTPLPDDPATPQDESAQSNTTTQSQSTLTTPGAPQTTDPMPSTTAQTTTGVDATTQAQSNPYAPGATTYGSTAATTDTYAGMGENVATPESLEQHARDAGMDAIPMTAQQVCMPREISLTTSGARLNRDKQHQLINAADRASVCEFQRVVINSPNGRADQARQLLIDHGVDAGMIEVVDSDTGGLEVEMNFAGIATSSEQYAQMFSTQQYASYQPSASQGAQPYAATPQSSDQPNTAPGTSSYQPANPAPSTSEGVWMGDPNVEVPENPTSDDMEDGMSPTSGRPAVQPGMLDI
jgi:hypothetical protein